MAENLKEIKARLKAITEQIKAGGQVRDDLKKELAILRELSKEARDLSSWESKRLSDLNKIGKFDKAAVMQMQAKSKVGQNLSKYLNNQIKLNAAAVKGEMDITDVIEQKNKLHSMTGHLGTQQKMLDEGRGKMSQEQINAAKEHVENMKKGLDVAMEVNDTALKRNELGDLYSESVSEWVQAYDDLTAKAKGFLKSLTPMNVLAAGFLGILVGIGKLFIGMVKSGLEMQKELGVGAGHAMDLNIATREAAVGGFMYGESIEDVAGRASTLVEEWGVVNKETKNSIKAATNLERLYGVSTTNAAQIAQMMESTSDSTKDVLLQDMGKEMKTLQKSGVPVGKIMEEIGEDTDFFAGHMKQGGKNIIKAAGFAKKLGMEMSSISGAAESLLDWDTSINAEMEASVLLGRNLNLQRARELAFAGDLEGMQKEIMKQVGSEAEFAEMNVMARQSLAEAVGLSVTDLAKMVAAEEKLANMSQTDLDALNQNQKVTNNIQRIWEGIIGIFQKMYKMFITPILKKIKSMLGFSKDIGPGFDNVDGILAQIEPKIESLVNWMSEIVVKIIEWGKETYEFVKTLGTTEEGVFSFKKAASELWEMFANKVKTVIAILAALTLGIWAVNLALAANPIGAIIVGVLALIALLSTVFINWDAIVSYIKNSALGEWFSGLGETIKGIFSGIGEFIGKIWDGLITILKAPFNLIIASWNMIIRGLNSLSIDIPGWLPFVDEDTTIGFNVPEIPSLQTEVGEGHKISAGGIAKVHTGESVGRFDMKETNEKLDMVVKLLSSMPTTDQAALWAKKQKSATEGAFANR